MGQMYHSVVANRLSKLERLAKLERLGYAVGILVYRLWGRHVDEGDYDYEQRLF